MIDFIKAQYQLYLAGARSIGIDKIKKLADAFMSEDERKALFKEEDVI